MQTETFMPAKKKPCHTCKKKAPVTKLEQPIETEYIPTLADIKLAYVELGNKSLTQDKKDFINKVYNFLFQEDFDFGCGDCANKQARKFRNYLIDKLKINL